MAYLVATNYLPKLDSHLANVIIKYEVGKIYDTVNLPPMYTALIQYSFNQETFF